MYRFLSIAFLILTSVLIAGCKQTATDNNSGDNNGASGLSSATKCETVTASGPLCYEYKGLPESGVSVAKASCDANKGTFTTKAACSRVSNVGGCTQGGQGANTAIGKLVIYVYAPHYSADKVKQLCQTENEQYVQP